MIDQMLIQEMQNHGRGTHAHTANKALFWYQKYSEDGCNIRFKGLRAACGRHLPAGMRSGQN
jgi:hypothetical protein